MEARAENSRVLATVGLLLGSAGCVLVVAGLLYCATGWRYGAVVAIWAAEWGLPLVGVGTGLARFGRRGTSAIAISGGLAGNLLIAIGEVSREYDSYLVAGAIGGVAILVGIASAIARRTSKV
jgi:hypothetical protein